MNNYKNLIGLQINLYDLSDLMEKEGYNDLFYDYRPIKFLKTGIFKFYKDDNTAITFTVDFCNKEKVKSSIKAVEKNYNDFEIIAEDAGGYDFIIKAVE